MKRKIWFFVLLLTAIMSTFLEGCSHNGISENNQQYPEGNTGAPIVVFDGQAFLPSGHALAIKKPPDGYVREGQVSDESPYFAKCSIYANKDEPLWVFIEVVKQDGVRYTRFVDVRISNKDLLSYDGKVFIALNTVMPEDEAYILYYTELLQEWGFYKDNTDDIGITCLGDAVFESYDSVPNNNLGTNFGEGTVFASEKDSRVLLIKEDDYSEGYRVFAEFNLSLLLKGA